MERCAQFTKSSLEVRTVIAVFSPDPFETRGVLIVCVFLKFPRILSHERSQIIIWLGTGCLVWYAQNSSTSSAGQKTFYVAAHQSASELHVNIPSPRCYEFLITI